jgi:hypothetical protein
MPILSSKAISRLNSFGKKLSNTKSPENSEESLQYQHTYNPTLCLSKIATPLSQAALSEAEPAPTKSIKAKMNFFQLRVAGFLTHCG